MYLHMGEVNILYWQPSWLTIVYILTVFVREAAYLSDLKTVSVQLATGLEDLQITATKRTQGQVDMDSRWHPIIEEEKDRREDKGRRCLWGTEWIQFHAALQF